MGASFWLFLPAALILAATPGPGIFFVAARTLVNGRRDGVYSSCGTALGGLVHVGAGALGVSAILLASAEAFAALKIAGALCLFYLGYRAWKTAGEAPKFDLEDGKRGLSAGFWVESLNPKTALFFLAFLPQFIDPATGPVALQFILLGLISVALNTTADLVAVFFAATLRQRLAAGGLLLKRARQASAVFFVAMGLGLLFARKPT